MIMKMRTTVVSTAAILKQVHGATAVFPLYLNFSAYLR
jgi:hypothetical protein